MAPQSKPSEQGEVEFHGWRIKKSFVLWTIPKNPYHHLSSAIRTFPLAACLRFCDLGCSHTGCCHRWEADRSPMRPRMQWLLLQVPPSPHQCYDVDTVVVLWVCASVYIQIVYVFVNQATWVTSCFLFDPANLFITEVVMCTCVSVFCASLCFCTRMDVLLHTRVCVWMYRCTCL